MRPQLETLESRTMMDAALANAFAGQLLPQLLQSRDIMEAHFTNVVQEGLALAEYSAALVGTPQAFASLYSLEGFAATLAASWQTANMEYTAEIGSIYQQLLPLPFSNNTAAIIDATAAELALLDSQLASQPGL